MPNKNKLINYESQKINFTNFKRVQGEVITADLWNSVLGWLINQHNKQDDVCTAISKFEDVFLEFSETFNKTLQEWELDKQTINEQYTDVKKLQSALAQSLVHCGDEKPNNPHTRLWIHRSEQPGAYNAIANEQYVKESIAQLDAKFEAALEKIAIPDVITGGDKFISVSDVSPLAHKCSCRLTSDTYADVIGDSNNIYDFKNYGHIALLESYSTNATLKINDDGSLTISPIDSTSILEARFFIKIYLDKIISGETYTASLRSDEEIVYDMCTFGGVSDDDVDFSPLAICTTFEADDKWDYYAYDVVISHPHPVPITFYPQLELGATMSDWQPYGEHIIQNKPYIEDFSVVKLNVNGKYYIPNTDGTVTDILSASPEMVVTTNNEYVNIHDFTYYADTKRYIDNNAASADFISVVNELPEVGEANRLYLIPKADTQGQDLFDEFLWINDAWEWITTKQVEVNLDEYMKMPAPPARNSVVTMSTDRVTHATSLVHESAPGWSVPLRDNDGCIKTATPKANLDAATKKYVDDAIAALKAELQGG